MSETTIADFIDGLLAVARAGMPTAEVRDGALPTDDTPDSELFIGMRQFEDDGLPEAVTDGEQDYIATNRRKDERFRLRCLAVGRNGADNLSAARQLAVGLINELGVLLRADPSCGGVVNVLYCELEVRDVDQGYTEEDGAVCRVQFDVKVRARI